jgi:hypothetical protein
MPVKGLGIIWLFAESLKIRDDTKNLSCFYSKKEIKPKRGRAPLRLEYVSEK